MGKTVKRPETITERNRLDSNLALPWHAWPGALYRYVVLTEPAVTRDGWRLGSLGVDLAQEVAVAVEEGGGS